MTERWLRWYDGTVRDGKFRIVAELSKVPVCTVIGVWASLLEDAATNSVRGIAAKGIEFHSLYLGIADGEVRTVWNAMERLGMIGNAGNGNDCFSIANWDKRQFETDAKDPTAKNRKEKWKQKHNRAGTDGNATERSGTPETETETETDKERVLVASATSDDWEKIKRSYPKRKGANPWKPAKAAYEASRKKYKTEDVPRLVLSALAAGVGFDRDKIGTEFIPRASTWFREERWADHVTAQPTGPPQAPSGLPSDDELRKKYGQPGAISAQADASQANGGGANNGGELRREGFEIRPKLRSFRISDDQAGNA